MEELNRLVRSSSEEERPLLLVLRAQALARLGERRDALDDARAVLAEPRTEKIEGEAVAIVRSLTGLAVELRAPRGPLLPGTASVAATGSGAGTFTLEWAVYRIDDARLREALARTRDLDALLRRPPPETLARAGSGSTAIEAHGPFEKKIDVDTRAPGLYLVAATVEGMPLRTTLCVARHALAARATPSGLLVWCVDRTTGEPREARVDLLARGLEGIGATDRSGVLEAAAPVRGELLAWSDGTIARLAVDVAAPTSATGADIVVDRPLVHPGERVSAAVLSAPSTRQAVFLRDSRGDALLAREVLTDAHGLGQLELEVPRAARTGAWTLEAPGGSARFRVEEPAPEPAFSVELPDVPASLATGEPLVAHVRARGLAGAAASWAIRRYGEKEKLLAGSGALDGDGELKIAARAVPAGELVLEASVSHGGREVREAVALHVLASRLEIALDREPPRVARPGDAVDLRCSFFDEEGKRARDVAIVASATLGGREVLRLEKPLEGNVASLHVPLDVPGRAVIGVRATSPLGVATMEKEVLVAPVDETGPPRLLLDRAEHRPGESVRVFATGFPREAASALVFKEGTHSLERLDRGSLLVELPLEGRDVPGVDIVVAAVHSGVLHAAREHVRVAPRPLDAALTVSGEPLVAEVRAEKPCEVFLWAVDARPFELLAATAARHGPARPRAAPFFSTALAIDAGDDARLEAPEDDEALLVRARRLALAPGTAFTGSSATFEVPVAGSIRVRALAACEGRFALAERTAGIEPSLAVATSLPERLVEGDEGELGASVSNALPVPQEVKIEWTARGLVLRGPPRVAGAALAGGHDPEADALWMALPPHGRADLVFLAKAPAPGVAQLEVDALGEKTRARAQGEALVLGRSGARERTENVLVGAAPATIDPSVPDAAHPDAVTAEVAVAPSLQAAARDALAELARSEERDAETLAARVFDVAPLLSAVSLEAAPVSTDSVLSLIELQEPDGAWPSSATASALEAIASVPSEGLLLSVPLARGIAAARRALVAASPAERCALALALAAAGAPPREEIERLKGKSDLDALARFTLGRGLLALGDRDGARALLAGARSTTAEGVAAELLLLARLSADEPRRQEIARELLARRTGVAWAAPRETLLAARALLEHAALSPARPAARLDLRAVDPSGHDLFVRLLDTHGTDSLRVSVPRHLLAKSSVLAVRQRGGALVPCSVRLRWTKLTQGLRPLERGISVRRTVEPLEPRGVPVGTELRVAVSIESHALEAIVVEEPLPAGARFLGEVGSSGALLEARPGRLLLRFPSTGSPTRTFSYALRACRQGDWRALVSSARLVGQAVGGESDEWLLPVRGER